MSAFVLIMRKIDTNQIQHILGVYSSWEAAWTLFQRRYSLGRAPFSGGRFPIYDKEALFYTVQQLPYSAKAILIFNNDFINVTIEKFPIDTVIDTI